MKVIIEKITFSTNRARRRDLDVPIIEGMAPVMAVAGPNGSGKSRLLRCIKDAVDAPGTGFKDLRSISLLPISELALSFTQPGTLGGQGVGYVRNVASKVINDHGSSIDKDDHERLSSIIESIDKIRSAAPVIFAVDIKDLAGAGYSSVTRAVHVGFAIPADKIMAKLQIQDQIDYSKIDVKKHFDFLHNLYWSPARHFVRLLPRA